MNADVPKGPKTSKGPFFNVSSVKVFQIPTVVVTLLVKTHLCHRTQSQWSAIRYKQLRPISSNIVTYEQVSL